MKKCLFFAIVAFAIITQSCGDNPIENSEFNRGGFANDLAATIKNESNKYVCDFQWTEGYKNWEYDFSGENPADSVKGIVPWCLIPYGNSGIAN